MKSVFGVENKRLSSQREVGELLCLPKVQSVASRTAEDGGPEGQLRSSPGRQPGVWGDSPSPQTVDAAAGLPVKETSASLSCPSWMLSLSDLELPRERFILRKYCPQRCRPASFFSRFSLARRFWNHTWGVGMVSGRPASLGARGPCRPRARGTRPSADLHHAHVQAGLGGELLPHVARRLGRSVVGTLQCLQLLGGDGRARSLGCGLGLCAGQTVRPASPLPASHPKSPGSLSGCPWRPGSPAKAAGGPAHFIERGAPADGFCLKNPPRRTTQSDTLLDPLILIVCVSQIFVVKAANSSWSRLLILPKRATSCSHRRRRDCYSGPRSSQLSAWGFRSPHLPAPNQFPSPAFRTERFPHRQ